MPAGSSSRAHVTVEPLPRDLVSLAQCMAIDADAFPHDSVRFTFAVREASARVLVARDESDGRVIGFIAGYLRPSAATATAATAATAGARVLHVYGIAVRREARGSGIGRALLRAMIARCTGERVSAMTLQVSTANRAAVSLYASERFTIARRMVGYYTHPSFGDGGSAYEMVLRLPQVAQAV